MKNSIVYYNAYSLESWITMILNGEVSLPEFQRYFVWDLKDALDLVKGICDESFVPPVIIASPKNKYDWMKGREGSVYLLDGQQRMSSILLFYLGYWITKTSTKESEDEDSAEEDEKEEWTFRDLQEKYKDCTSPDDLRKKLGDDKRYVLIRDVSPSKTIKKEIIEEAVSISNKFSDKSESITSKRMIGFSFIKSMGKLEEEKRFFAHVFKDINTKGRKLNPEESRQALYWLNPDLKGFFRPDFIRDYTINKQPVDFGRFLSLVGEVYKEYKETTQIVTDYTAYGYSRRLEDYIVEYVTEIVEGEASTEKTYMGNIGNLEEACNLIFGDVKNAANTHEFELKLFGLLFWVLFDSKKLTSDTVKIGEIKRKLEEKISKVYNERAVMTTIREDLEFSIGLYKDYVE